MHELSATDRTFIAKIFFYKLERGNPFENRKTFEF